MELPMYLLKRYTVSLIDISADALNKALPHFKNIDSRWPSVLKKKIKEYPENIPHLRKWKKV